jgi:choloylglycine hydrolase
MCTTFRLTAKDGSVVVGRSMEYALPLNWDLLITPRGTAGGSTGPNGPGVQWTTKYGYAGIALGTTTNFGITTPGQNGISDGANEAGLYAGELYLPGFTQYPATDGVPAEQLLTPLDMCNFVLATCATVAEAIEAMHKVTVWAISIPPIGVPPLHLVLHDGTGATAVLEWIGGEMQVNDAPLGVATNAPPFPWHMTNLSNYVNLSVLDVEPIDLDGETFAAIGAGSGWLGLPGDFTPPSRFVRAVAFSDTAYPDDDSAGAARTALHILGSFDIPKGTVRAKTPEGISGAEAQAAGLGDFTSFVTVSELGAAPAYSYRMYDDLTPRRLPLTEATVGSGEPRRASLMGKSPFVDVTI